VKLLLSAALAAALMDGQIALPPQTSEVKYLHGRIVSLESNGPGGWLIVRNADGSITRKVEAGAGLEGLRRAEIKDFTMDADGTLVVSVGVEFPFGRSSRIAAFYPEKGSPRFLTLDDVVCLRLAADPSTGVWCMGDGLEQSLLHRISGPAQGPWSLLPKKKIRVLANPGGDTREPFDSGQLGAPSMIVPEPGRLLLFLPNSVALYDCDLQSGTVEVHPLPFNPRGRSWLSFAAEGTRTFGLFPLLEPGQDEQLTTSYGLFQMGSSWKRVDAARTWPRGVSLSGMDGGVAVLWNRPRQRLESISLPAGR